MGNTYSIPPFSILCLGTKFLAASPCRFNQSFPRKRPISVFLCYSDTGGFSFLSYSFSTGRPKVIALKCAGCTKADGAQPKSSAACISVQFCLADADRIVFSNYHLIGTWQTSLAFATNISMQRPNRPSCWRACHSRRRCRTDAPDGRGCSGRTCPPLPSFSARTPHRRTTWS